MAYIIQISMNYEDFQIIDKFSKKVSESKSRIMTKATLEYISRLNKNIPNQLNIKKND